MITYQKSKKIFTSSLVSVKHGFGTKQTNVQTFVGENIFITPKQIHSSEIEFIQNQKNYQINPCDGIITNKKRILLSVVTADCVPIIFVDSIKNIIGISHQGWKGTLNRLPSKMIDKLVMAGSHLNNLYCVIGPSINDCCYEIYGDRLLSFKKEFKTNSIFRETKDMMFLNLIKTNYQSLIERGIHSTHIDFFPFCTSCNSDTFWSYHRDKQIVNEMISFVML